MTQPRAVVSHLRRSAVAVALCVPLVVAAACSSGEEPSATPGETGEPGVTAPVSTPAPPVSTTNPAQHNRQSCAEVFQILNTSLSKLNAAMKLNKKEPVTKAVADLRSAATSANGIATKSGDKKLVELTDAVGASIRILAKRFQNDEDAETAQLNDRTDALQDYCNTFVPAGAKASSSSSTTSTSTSATTSKKS